MSGRGLRLKSLTARGGKYGAVRTTVDGISFASKKEALTYGGLMLAQKMGEIADLKLQPRIDCCVVGYGKICTYVADFYYFDKRKQKPMWVDAKGFKTPVYKLKKKLVLALTGIEITEV